MHPFLLEQLAVITEEERSLLAGRSEIDRRLYYGHEGSPKVEAALLLEQGKLITLRAHTRFVHFPAHTHDYVEMVYMCQGQTRHRINGNEIRLEEGELLILGQGATQEIAAAGERDIAVNFIILPQFFETALQLLHEQAHQVRTFLTDCLQDENGGTGYLHFKVTDILPIQNLIENLIWTLVNHQPNKRSVNQLTMALLFLQLANHTDTLQTDSLPAEQQLILPVHRYIEEHYTDGELRQIARELHYDPCWLSREIKRQTGKTFTELLQDKRLSQAAFLLKTTGMKVMEVSESIGYANPSYFHRLFYKQYGMSPHKYRQCK